MLPISDLGASEEPHVVTDVDGVHLRGSRCMECGERFFPSRVVCFGCAGHALEESLLGPVGTLYSFTTVHVSSTRSTPYTIGYVDLDEGVRVLGFVRSDPGELRPDQRVHLVADGDGEWAVAADNPRPR